ncbi:ricin-type beta-trefoil lectin domain protein [Actinoallomurus acanthiterrae]
MGRWKRSVRRAPLAALALAATLVTGLAVPATAQTDPQKITVDPAAPGRVYEGVGAISGGGGTSRLIVDYPERQRRQILDYLFKPGYGASLDILKVEIGSDTDSSNGAEPSHARVPGEVNCDRGYEWWLMSEAKKRNPAIKLYGLEWGAPGWFHGGFWSQDNIAYVTDWLGCARRHHLSIDYLGGWNEKGWDKQWYVDLRAALDRTGYGHVKLVAADNAGWQVATDLKNDAAFNAAVDAVGIHYPCSAVHCSSSADAIGLGKPIFASESGWNDYLTGAPRLASEINHEYVDGRMTAFINWPAAYGWYPTVQYAGSGFLRANEPWSGHYELGPTLWTVAQTSQFARPGWRYLDSASGYLDGGGTYVTLRSPAARPDLTTVVETTAATGPQTITVNPARGLSRGRLHVWSTELSSADPATWLARGDDLRTDADGSYKITLEPGRVYTLTTLGGGGKGAAVSPAAAGLSLPFTESFDGYRRGATARYFTDMEGAFEVAKCAPGSHRGKCLRQVITTQPNKWTKVPAPLTLVGDAAWTDYETGTDVLLEQAGSAELLGRIVGQLDPRKKPNLVLWKGYHLKVADTGAWSLYVVQNDGTTRTLAAGTVDALGTGRWHHLALRFEGTAVSALVDGRQVAAVTDATFDHGQSGLALDSYVPAQFDSFAVTAR